MIKTPLNRSVQMMRIVAVVFGLLLPWLQAARSLRLMEVPERAPFGPRMCDDYCRRFSRCSTPVYDPVTLSCQAKTDDLFDELGNKLKKRLRDYPVTCNRPFQIIYNRRGFVCVSVAEHEKGIAGERMLILSGNGEENKQVILSKGTQKMIPYPFLQTKTATNVGFLKSERQLVLFTDKGELIYIPIGKRAIIAEVFAPRNSCAMAVDSLTGFIFFASKTLNTVFKGSRWRHFESVWNRSGICCTIGVDWLSKRLLLVYGTNKALVSIDYTGKKPYYYEEMSFYRLLVFHDGTMYSLSKYGLVKVNDVSRAISSVPSDGLSVYKIHSMGFFRGTKYFVLNRDLVVISPMRIYRERNNIFSGKNNPHLIYVT